MALHELEKWSKELEMEKRMLQTGQKQPDAIRLYEKNNYKTVPILDKTKTLKTVFVLKNN